MVGEEAQHAPEIRILVLKSRGSACWEALVLVRLETRYAPVFGIGAVVCTYLGAMDTQ